MDIWVLPLKTKIAPYLKTATHTYIYVNYFFEPVLKCEFVELLQFSKKVKPIYCINEVFLIFKSS